MGKTSGCLKWRTDSAIAGMISPGSATWRKYQRSIILLSNIQPCDVLSAGKPEDIRNSVKAALESVEDKTRIILSCGGAVPPGVPTENIRAFLSAAGHS